MDSDRAALALRRRGAQRAVGDAPAQSSCPRMNGEDASMKYLASTALLLVTATASMAQPIGFDDDTAGNAPAGWSCGSTGGDRPRWAVAAATDAPSKPN